MPAKSVQKVSGKSDNPFSKIDPGYWEKVVFLPKKKLKGRTYKAKIFHVKIQHQNIRHEFSTGFGSKRAAGKMALEIYTFLRGNGWYATKLKILRRKPKFRFWKFNDWGIS